MFNAALNPNPNPNRVTVTVFNAATGWFEGSFTLPGATAAQNRVAPFYGQIVNLRTGSSGLGYFLLPQVPVAPQTVTTSPKLSGRVELAP